MTLFIAYLVIYGLGLPWWLYIVALPIWALHVWSVFDGRKSG